MDLSSLLQSTFGFARFRVNQEAVCHAATEGRDVLLVMPTGAGKSLCYQLPAIARGGTALVISPLIALMDDQATKLTAAGLRVARIHSGLSREDARQACRDYLDGKLQFLFIAPERMRVPGFPEMLARRKPALIAIDEAHCISAWGHDFRPDYRTLGAHLPALRPAPIIALTATATPAVQKDIVAQLGLQQPALFIHGFRRDNLAIEVVELAKPRRTEFTTKFLTDAARRPAIVYAPSRKAAEELAAELNRTPRKALDAAGLASSVPATKRLSAAAYHAGLEPSVRERVQRDFQSGRLEIVVATIAFGMGIDKADVRTVVHYALPASVEAFYQEIGRAGRDGKPARTVLLYSFADRKLHDLFLERDYPVVNDLVRMAKVLTDEFLMPDYLASRLKMSRDIASKALEKLAAQGAAQFDMAGNVRAGDSTDWQSGYVEQVQFRRLQIERMMQFAETQQCRMSALIRHFGDVAGAHKPCGQCDFCAPSATLAQSSASPSTSQERDLRAILKALEGGPGKSTGRLHTDLALSPDRKVFDGLLEGLARAGLIAVRNETFTNPEGQVITFKKASLTQEGQSLKPSDPLGVLLRGDFGAEKGSTTAKRSSRIRGAKANAEPHAYTPQQSSLDEQLRAWRKAEAAKTGKPAFLVCSDAALHALVLACPKTIPALLEISGFGPDKSDRYGAAICAICREAPLPAATGDQIPAPAPKTRTPKPVAAPQSGITRKTAVAAEHPSLTGDQQALEDRLREWRRFESEKMGLPQFFVLGTSALRSIVLARPRTLAQLQAINGINTEKLDRFGASILELTNAPA